MLAVPTSVAPTVVQVAVTAVATRAAGPVREAQQEPGGRPTANRLESAEECLQELQELQESWSGRWGPPLEGQLRARGSGA